MKTARIILAVLSLAALGACGNDTITGPVGPGAARYETAPATGNDGTIGDSTDTTQTEGGTTEICNGTVVHTTDPSGNVTTTCVSAPDKGGTYGSGG